MRKTSVIKTMIVRFSYRVGDSAESVESVDVDKLAMNVSYFINQRGDAIKCSICRQILAKLMKAVMSAKLVEGQIIGSIKLTDSEILHLQCNRLMRPTREGGRLYDEVFDLMVSIRENVGIAVPKPPEPNYHL